MQKLYRSIKLKKKTKKKTLNMKEVYIVLLIPKATTPQNLYLTHILYIHDEIYHHAP